MPKLGPIFAGGQEEEEMKPLYEHLDGTVEVLGFEQYGLNQVLPTLSKENHQYLQESIEADLALLETIQGHQRLTEQQDSGINAPNYEGLSVDKQKTELSEDAKKFYQEKGLDYRAITTEGFTDKIKEIWHWIVEKLRTWWDRLFSSSKSSSASAEKQHNVTKKLAKEGKEAIQAIEGNEDAVNTSFEKANNFGWTKETLGSLVISGSVNSMEDLKRNTTETLTSMGKARNFANEFNIVIQNQLKAFLTAFDKQEGWTAEMVSALQTEFYTKLKSACEHHLVKEGHLYYLMLSPSVDPVVVAINEQGQLVLDKRTLADVDKEKAKRLEAFEQGTETIEKLRQDIANDWKEKLDRKQGAPLFEHLSSALEDTMNELTKLEDVMGAIVGTLKALGDKLSSEPPQGKTEDENTHIKALTTAFTQASLLCSGIAQGLQNHFHATRNVAGTLINFLCGIALTDEASLAEGKAIKDTMGKWSVKNANASKESFENQLPDVQIEFSSLEAEFIEIHREDPKPSVEEYFNGRRFVTRVSTEGLFEAVRNVIKKILGWVKDACSRIWNTLTGKDDGGKTPSGFSGKTEALEERLKELDEPIRKALKGMSKEDWEKLSKDLAHTKFVKMIYCGFNIDTKIFEHFGEIATELTVRQDIAGKILNAVHSLGEISMTLTDTSVGFSSNGFEELDEKLRKVYNEGVIAALNGIEPIVKRSHTNPMTERSLASLNSSKMLTINRKNDLFDFTVVDVEVKENENYKLRGEDFDDFVKEKGVAFFSGLMGDQNEAINVVRDIQAMTKGVRVLIGSYRKTLDEFNKLQTNISKLDIDHFTIQDGYVEVDSSKTENVAKKLRESLTVVSRSVLAVGRIVLFIRDDIDGFLTQLDNFISRLETVE